MYRTGTLIEDCIMSNLSVPLTNIIRVMEDVGVYGRMILKWIFKNYGGMDWI
jgi:hypothetical protein